MITRTYHQDGTGPALSQVFVFGSNLSGLHAGGAARAAADLYGAQTGVAEGPTGRSYAIPTVQAGFNGALSLAEIKAAVVRFLAYAYAHPEQRFLVTRIGCGIAGHRDADIAPMFADAPCNCSLPDAWSPYLADDDSDEFDDPAMTPLDRFCMTLCVLACVFGVGFLTYEWLFGVGYA